MKIRILAALAPVVAGGVDARGVENLRTHDSKDDGERHPDAVRIIGGSEAVEGRFPYAVSLQNGPASFCGGSLIAKDVVLTAAHCMLAPGVFTPSVVLGRHDLNDSNGEVFAVRDQVSHPDYDEMRMDNDFMLIFLAGASTADDVVTVKLNSNPSVPDVGRDVTVMGWGDTNINVIISESSDVLMNIDVSIISNEECDANELFTGSITDSMLCAKVANGQSVCYGDSGGPLVVKGDDGGSDLLVGIVSWGVVCLDQFPNVYSRVSRGYDWIQSAVCNGSVYASEAGFDCSSVSTQCIDTFGWVDGYDDGCDWYEANDYPGCPAYGTGDYGGMGVADDNCCWCIG